MVLMSKSPGDSLGKSQNFVIFTLFLESACVNKEGSAIFYHVPESKAAQS